MCISSLLRLPLVAFVCLVFIAASSRLEAQSRPGGVSSLLWYDATQGVGLMTGGTNDSVAYWAEMSGSADQLLPAGVQPGNYSLRPFNFSVRPHWVTLPLWGTMPVVQFRRAFNERVTSPGNNRVTPVNNQTFTQKMISVCFSLSSTGALQTIWHQGNAAKGLYLRVSAGNNLVCGVYDNTTALGAGGKVITSTATLLPNTRYIATMIFDATSGLSLFLNGASAGVAGTGGNLTAHDATGVVLGTDYNGANGLDGYVGELVYANAASQAVRIIWENYLSQRWGIALNGIAEYFAPTHSGYDYNLIGIGRTSASAIVSESEFGSNGLFLKNKTSIVDNGDFILAANNNATGTTTISTNDKRLNRQWTFVSTNVGAAEGLVTLMYDPIEEGSFTQIYNIHDYYLMIDGVKASLGQGYLKGGRVCFDVSVSAINNKEVTFGTQFAVAFGRYQPAGVSGARLWLDANPTNTTARIGSSSIRRMSDQSTAQYDARIRNVADVTSYNYTATPDYTEDLYGLGINGFQFKTTGTTGFNAMRVLTSAGQQPNNLNQNDYISKMLVAFFKPTNATAFTGSQVLYEQGTDDAGFNIYLYETGGVRSLYTGVWRDRSLSTGYRIFHNTNLVANNTTNYLVSWAYNQNMTGLATSFVNGTSIGSTSIPLTAGVPFRIKAHAGDNVGIGGIQNETRHHYDDPVTNITNSGEFFQGNLWEIIHFDDSRMSLRRLAENYIAAKYGHSIAASLYSLANAGASVNQLVGIGRHNATLSDSVNVSNLSSGGLYIQNAAFLQDNGDYLLAAHDNNWGVTPYNGGNGQLLARLWYVDTTDVTTIGAGGNVTLIFAIDEEGSDRNVYLTPQYFIRDSTNHTEIGLGTATAVTLSATDRRVVFTLNAALIADRFITLGVKDKTLPVECNCTHTNISGTNDDDNDGLVDGSDPDCMNRWRCNGEFVFSEFSASGDPSQATIMRKIVPGGAVSFTEIATSSRLRKVDATGYQRRDSLVYGFINEGIDVNHLVRIQRNGTMIDLGVPLAGSTSFPAGASNFVAGDGYMGSTSSILGYAFANNAVGATKYVGVVRFDPTPAAKGMRPTVAYYNALVFSDGTTGVPDFSDMAFDPTQSFDANVQAYAFDVNQRILIRVNVNTGSCIKVPSASAQAGYTDLESMFFTEFGELYGYATTSVATLELVHVNKTSGLFTPVGTGPGVNQVDGCGCGTGIAVKVTPVDTDNVTPITSVLGNGGTVNVKYRVDIQNNTGQNLTTLTFAENFGDSRQFTAFQPITPTVQSAIRINGGATGGYTFTPSSSIAITGLRSPGTAASPVTTSFVLTVAVPVAFEGSTIYTQPTLGNVSVQFGGAKLSDYVVTSTALKDATPLNILVPLPVEWASFDATPFGNSVRLDWATYQESNNAGFEVERSFDAQSWTTIASMPGKGDSHELQPYTAWDNNPIPGQNHYRIRQTDIDGKSSVSETRTVSFSEANGLVMQAFPNPATPAEVLNVAFSGTAFQAHYELTITDLSGHIVSLQTIAAKEGTTMIEIPLNALASGLYVITLSSELHTVSQKLIIR